jgi:hypothetical protein
LDFGQLRNPPFLLYYKEGNHCEVKAFSIWSVVFDVQDAVEKQGFLQTRLVDVAQLESH